MIKAAVQDRGLLQRAWAAQERRARRRRTEREATSLRTRNGGGSGRGVGSDASAAHPRVSSVALSRAAAGDGRGGGGRGGGSDAGGAGSAAHAGVSSVALSRAAAAVSSTVRPSFLVEGQLLCGGSWLVSDCGTSYLMMGNNGILKLFLGSGPADCRGEVWAANPDAQLPAASAMEEAPAQGFCMVRSSGEFACFVGVPPVRAQYHHKGSDGESRAAAKMLQNCDKTFSTLESVRRGTKTGCCGSYYIRVVGGSGGTKVSLARVEVRMGGGPGSDEGLVWSSNPGGSRLCEKAKRLS